MVDTVYGGLLIINSQKPYAIDKPYVHTYDQLSAVYTCKLVLFRNITYEILNVAGTKDQHWTRFGTTYRCFFPNIHLTPA